MTIKLDQFILQRIGILLQPLTSLSDEEGPRNLIDALNWDAEALGITDPSIFVDIVQQLSDTLDSLNVLQEKDNINIFELAENLTKLATAIVKLKNQLSSLAIPAGAPANILATMCNDILDFLITYYLASVNPRLSVFLQFLGIFPIIETPEIKDTAGKILRAASKLRYFDLGATSKMLRDPLGYVRQKFLLDETGKRRLAIDVADLIGPELACALREIGLTAGFGILPDISPALTPGQADSAKHMLIIDAPIATDAENGTAILRLIIAFSDENNDIGIVLITNSDLNISFDTAIGHVSGELSGAFEPLLITQETVAFASPATGGPVNFRATLGYQSNPAKAPILLLGSANGSRFEIGEVQATIGFLSDSQGVDIIGTVDLKDILLAINGGDGDGFLSSILPQKPLEAKANIGIDISVNKGIRIRGSGEFDINLPLHISFGPIQIQSIRIAIKLGSSDKIPIELGGTLKTELGPLVAVVENIGLMAAITSLPSGGNLGPMDLSLGFKPPNGVGLSLDCGVIKGGGFLYFDADKGEYIGALELDFQGMFSLKAVGIINTKMPDGSKGFSLLIIITAEFSPIQLSFGFVLIGVGGLLGLNRTSRIDVLQEGIKTNALKSVLFPQDVVANINRIVSDLKQIFPPQEDRFIIGPMAKIGWGTPAIITLEMGLLLEIPVPRIAILGVLKAVLPEENAATLIMQINFLGVIDFENKFISFDASLYDSRLLVYTLTGDMAFRLSWGDNPFFVLSVGGFHPSFRDAPSDLQQMTRLTISLLSGNNPRLSVQCYFAVTSNTVQFGALAELYAEAGGFNIYGFVGYDVLFRFDPFHFVAAIYAGLALRRDSSVLMSVKVAGELAGPSPWDVRGEASFSILFFDVTVSFHETWGDRIDKVEPEKIDIVALLAAEVVDTRNWKAEIPDNNSLHVTIGKIDLSNDIPKKIEISRFENEVLNRIKEAADKQYIQGFYTKNANGDSYVLANPPNDAEKDRIIAILKTVQYYNLVVHPFGVLVFSERLAPLGVPIDKFGSYLPKDVNIFELTEVKSNSSNLPTEVAKENFARANFFNMNDSEKLSHASFDQMPSGFRIAASHELKTGKPIIKNVLYELSYLREKRLVRISPGIYRLAMSCFSVMAKGSAVAKSSLSRQNNRISRNAPEAVAICPEKYVLANVRDMQSHSPELVADSYSEALVLYRELITQNPELKGQIQILSDYEMSMN